MKNETFLPNAYQYYNNYGLSSYKPNFINENYSYIPNNTKSQNRVNQNNAQLNYNNSKSPNYVGIQSKYNNNTYTKYNNNNLNQKILNNKRIPIPKSLSQKNTNSLNGNKAMEIQERFDKYNIK